MTDLDRAELRQLAESALPDGPLGAYTFAGTGKLRSFQSGFGPKDALALLDALDEAEKERGKAIAEVARQQALRVENGRRFEQMRSERTAALARAETAEAAIERVRALIIRAGTYGPDEFGAFKRDLALAALAPVTEEGDSRGL